MVFNNLISNKNNLGTKIESTLVAYSHRGHVKKSLLSMPLSFGLPYCKLTHTKQKSKCMHNEISERKKNAKMALKVSVIQDTSTKIALTKSCGYIYFLPGERTM